MAVRGPGRARDRSQSIFPKDNHGIKGFYYNIMRKIKGCRVSGSARLWTSFARNDGKQIRGFVMERCMGCCIFGRTACASDGFDVSLLHVEWQGLNRSDGDSALLM